MSLLEANWCPRAAIMLNNGKEISNEKKAELKATFLEGLIRFLDIYAQTEIGEGIQIDIMKVALHINSAQFENDDLYAMKSIEDVYKLCEELAIAGMPIWRFLRLSEYQSKVFEAGYSEFLISAKRKAVQKSPCYGCVWYCETDTFLGTLEECKRPRMDAELYRREPPNPEIIKECEWLTTLDSIPKGVNALDDSTPLARHRKNTFLNSVESARKQFQKELQKDPFRIPKTLSKEEIIALDRQYDAWENFGKAWKNERTYTERQTELRKAMYLEGMIRFFEIYAKCEIGNSYIADIKKIALYVDEMEESEMGFTRTFDDVYVDLENKIINGFSINDFIKFDEELC